MPTDQSCLSPEGKGLRSYDWLLSYRTSTTTIDGRPVDMLHDFYVPALSRAVQYDRVAGYFRSSSLAAASQGFSAFVGRQGKMRLIVGADLEPADVKAILAGDKERLARRLNSELAQPAAWPQDVHSGVTLLAWMVAHDYLEVRIAFRVHGQTGEPLAWDAVEDGYVHEKWFILHDEFGQRLYGAGTLNESKTALVLNAENIDVHCDWWGGTDYQRVEQAAADYERLWAGHSPHVAVLSIPEAVRQRLITLSEQIQRPLEVDGSSAAPPAVPSPSALERLQFAILKDAPYLPGGRYVGLETAPVAPWPHQAVVVRRLIESWPHSHLLCDEVGLGKTIEAGLAFRSLYLSGLARRILVAPPSSLTEQWQRQMAEKMLLPFARVLTGAQPRHQYIFPEEKEEAAASIYEPDLVIVSNSLLAREDRRRALRMAPSFDIALVDEAHKARRQNPNKGVGAYPDFGQLYLAVRDCLRQKTSSLWLATATPMQIHPVEVCDLLALTNRVGAFQYDATLTLQYYEILAKIIRGQDPDKEEWEFLRRSVQAIQMQDPLLWRYFEESVIDGRIRIAVRRWLEDSRIPRSGDRELMCRLLFSASPLSRVMLRHTRRLLEIYREKGELKENLARRHILPLPRIAFSDLEQRIYDQLEDYCNGLTRQISKHGDGQAQTAMGFLLSFFRLRFASSLYALRETLKRRLLKVEATLDYQLIMETEEEGSEIASLQDQVTEGEGEDDAVAVESLLKNRSPADLRWERERLEAMIAAMADLTGPSPKMEYLLSTLNQRRDAKTGRIKQTVVFTRFYDTLVDIVTHLRRVDPKMLIGTYSGQGLGGQYLDPSDRKMVAVKREDVKERFLRGEIDVLVCTDAAAEGLNLQTADLLVNFDLGWNPMKIEQRIGRIDRIGQKHQDIYVLNLCYVNTAEEIVYVRLLNRLAQANLIVGTQQLSLLPVGLVEFQKLAEKKMSEEELMALAERRIKEQRERTESMEMDPQDLYEIYARMSRSGRQLAPLKLGDIWEALSQSTYLNQLGCSTSGSKQEPVMKVAGIAGVPDGAILTSSRKLYDEGLAGESSRIHFASYGDPYFQAILAQVAEFELSPCIRRLAAPIPGLEQMEMVAYAVAGRNASGELTVQLVKSWDDLKTVQLAENVALDADAIQPLQEELQQIARKEFKHYLAAKRIERHNIRAAQAQRILSLLVIYSLIKIKTYTNEEEALFWPILEEIEGLFKDRKVIHTVDLPADMLRGLADDLLFDCTIPAVGSNAHLRTPRVLATAALDSARQVADSMKVHKNALKAKTVLARLRREAEKSRQQIQ